MRAFLERHFEILDFAIVALISATIFSWGHWADHDSTLLKIMNGNRAATYGAIVGLFGTVFGFALTAMSIVLAFGQSPRLMVLRRSRQWLALWRVFTRGIRVFISVAVLAVTAMIFDRDRSPNVLFAYALMFAMFLGIARLYRIIWAFEKLIFIMAQPDRNGSEWHRPMETRQDTVRVR